MVVVALKDYIYCQLRTLCIRIVFLVLMYFLFRIVFYVANMEYFPSGSLSVFFYGMQFDLSAIFYTNAPCIIAVLLPFTFCHTKIYRKICDVCFILINSFAAFVSCIDVAYFPYVLKRMTADIFSYIQIGFDFRELLPSFLEQFWYLLIIFIATLFAIVFVVRLTNRMTKSKPVFQVFSWRNFLYTIIIFLASVFISVIFMRGGWQLRPITLIDTGKYASIQNAPLTSNTPFTLIHSLGKQNNIEKHYYQDLEEAELYFKPVLVQIAPCLEDCYPVRNVVVIVLESFSQYLVQDRDTNTVGYQGYCPFVDSLLHKSISFNGIANGRRTIEALPAVFGGIPTLLDMSYVETSFANNYSFSPVEILKRQGYSTLFFHGAKNGSMNIESYCYSIGFEKFYGKNEYPHPSDYDGIWGISDRPYLKYVAKILNSVSSPFFAGILTLSSHNPFILPKDAEGLDIKQGEHPMQTVASYTDYALREFFNEISHYSWYDSTLFVF
ncbi:MAG: sulfatase-like hydrolase/transferase, partial [Bacteroidales bacterium]|nr:sulfatase-like hydrolase/transferase [Bacteroidales bacterium]